MAPVQALTQVPCSVVSAHNGQHISVLAQPIIEVPGGESSHNIITMLDGNMDEHPEVEEQSN